MRGLDGSASEARVESKNRGVELQGVSSDGRPREEILSIDRGEQESDSKKERRQDCHNGTLPESDNVGEALTAKRATKKRSNDWVRGRRASLDREMLWDRRACLDGPKSQADFEASLWGKGTEKNRRLVKNGGSWPRYMSGRGQAITGNGVGRGGWLG